jgi:hypothetical protein
MYVTNSGCDDDDTAAGSGSIVTETRDLNAFTAASATSSIDLLILYGAKQEEVVRADDNIVALIVTTVRDGALTVTRRRGTGFQNSTTSVELVLPDLVVVELNSASDAVITNYIFPGPVTFDLNSASDLEIAGSAPRAIF